MKSLRCHRSHLTSGVRLLQSCVLTALTNFVVASSSDVLGGASLVNSPVNQLQNTSNLIYFEKCSGTQRVCRADQSLYCDTHENRCVCSFGTIYDSSRRACVRQYCSGSLGCPDGEYYCADGVCVSCWLNGINFCAVDNGFYIPKWIWVVIIIAASLILFGSLLLLICCCDWVCCSTKKKPIGQSNDTQLPPSTVIYPREVAAPAEVPVQRAEWQPTMASVYVHPGQLDQSQRPSAPNMTEMPQWELPPSYFESNKRLY